MPNLTWPGASGIAYTYEFININLPLPPVPANYLFLSGGPAGFTILYAGETADLSSRCANHERIDEAARLGARYVCAHANRGGVLARQMEERDLILRWQPVLNTQHRRLAH